MIKRKKSISSVPASPASSFYEELLQTTISLIEEAKRESARQVNHVMTTTYWLIGKRIVQSEQQGAARAEYGQALLKKLSSDLSQRVGRGFSVDRLEESRLFYLAYPAPEISETVSRKSSKPLPLQQNLGNPPTFALSFSHYILLLRRTRSKEAHTFYETEALRGGWTVRQLERQIDSQFYERALLSKNKAALLKKESPAKVEFVVTPEEAIKDPFVLEFLGLKDQYSESKLEDDLIENLEGFLLELGNDFTFAGRQKRLRIGSEWYRVDLLLFHRRLRCLVIIDLKIGRLTHADTGQMNLYLNYAKEHWTLEGENPPVGLILCSQKEEAVAHYALGGLQNKVLAGEYKTVLPDEKLLEAELQKTQKQIEDRMKLLPKKAKRTKAK